MPQLVKQEVLNTIPIPVENQPDYEYENLLEEGKTGTYIAGLVAIKNVKRQTQWGEKDSYRFSFRVARDKTCRAYINTTVNASCKSNSSMYKMLRCMSGKKINTLPNSEYADADKLFKFMLNCLDHWFEVDAIGVKLNNGDIMMCVDGMDVRPARGNVPSVKPSEYFEDVMDNSTKPVQVATPGATGFEGYPDASAKAEHDAETKEIEEDDIPW